jgi:hypothetical protein
MEMREHEVKILSPIINHRFISAILQAVELTDTI